jgi:hypothetical protein
VKLMPISDETPSAEADREDPRSVEMARSRLQQANHVAEYRSIGLDDPQLRSSRSPLAQHQQQPLDILALRGVVAMRHRLVAKPFVVKVSYPVVSMIVLQAFTISCSSTVGEYSVRIYSDAALPISVKVSGCVWCISMTLSTVFANASTSPSAIG